MIKTHNYTKFQELVAKAGLTEELNNFDNATVFIPSNQAFENPETVKLLEGIGNDQAKLQQLIRYHVINGEVESTEMSNDMKIPTKDAGKELRVNLYSTVS